MPPNAQIRAFSILREERQDYLAVVLRGWLNKENKIRSLLRILSFFYASKCSNQSLWHFAGRKTGSPSVGLYYLHKKTAALSSSSFLIFINDMNFLIQTREQKANIHFQCNLHFYLSGQILYYLILKRFIFVFPNSSDN